MKQNGILRRTIRKGSVFWRYFLMMCCLLVLLVAAQLVSNRMLTRTITENKLRAAEDTLVLNCERLSTQWFSLNELPEIVEKSQLYSLIAQLRADRLPDTYVTVPRDIRDSIQSHAYLLGPYETAVAEISVSLGGGVVRIR